MNVFFVRRAHGRGNPAHGGLIVLQTKHVARERVQPPNVPVQMSCDRAGVGMCAQALGAVSFPSRTPTILHLRFLFWVRLIFLSNSFAASRPSQWTFRRAPAIGARSRRIQAVGHRPVSLLGRNTIYIMNEDRSLPVSPSPFVICIFCLCTRVGLR